MDENEKKGVEATPTPVEPTVPEAEVAAEPASVMPVTVETVEETKTVTVTAETTAPVAEKPISKRMWLMYVAAIVIVVGILLVVLFSMERQGRIETGVFDGVESFMQTRTTVATVNGVKITGAEYNTSVQQLLQAAAAQGADTTSPEVIASINERAIEVLVNTELLKQEAAEKGIVSKPEDVEARIATLVTEIGGEEILKERMATLQISDEQLRRDIGNEIVIQAYLDQLFSEVDLSVSETEITELYAAAGGAEAGLPPLEEVREQVSAQIRSNKEQEFLDGYIAELKTGAEIEINQ